MYSSPTNNEVTKMTIVFTNNTNTDITFIYDTVGPAVERATFIEGGYWEKRNGKVYLHVQVTDRSLLISWVHALCDGFMDLHDLDVDVEIRG